MPAETNVMFRLFAGVIVQTPTVIDVNVTGNAEVAEAPDANGDAVKAVAPGLLKVIVCGVPAMVIVAACVEFGRVPLAACTVKLNTPVAVGVPEMMPVAGAKLRPVGSAPADKVQVIGTVPVAVYA